MSYVAGHLSPEVLAQGNCECDIIIPMKVTPTAYNRHTHGATKFWIDVNSTVASSIKSGNKEQSYRFEDVRAYKYILSCTKQQAKDIITSPLPQEVQSKEIGIEFKNASVSVNPKNPDKRFIKINIPSSYFRQ